MKSRASVEREIPINFASLFFEQIGAILRVKNWEIIADNLSEAGWSWGCVSAVDSRGRTIFIADAHRGDGKRFVVRADEILAAFLGTLIRQRIACLA